MGAPVDLLVVMSKIFYWLEIEGFSLKRCVL
jgi:hypothetical protein